MSLPPITSPPQVEQPDGTEPSRPANQDRPRARWGGLVAALRFLLPVGRGNELADPGSYGRAATWLVPLGLLTGLAWAGTFKASWRLYGEIANIRVVPAMNVVLLECLLTGPFMALGLARTINLLTGTTPMRPAADRASPLSPVGTLALCLTVLSMWVLIVSVPTVSPWWPGKNDWRYFFRHLYPAPVYRPLVLAPMWGRWAILLAATIGRTAKYADAQTVELSRAMRPGRLLRLTVFLLALTSIYLSREGNYATGVMVGLLVFGVTYGVSVAMARRGGGQTRHSLYAAGQIGQLSFLALYRAFWPLIHG